MVTSRDSGRVVCVVFLCQAEDGIRDLVRSRGLGDVYKRQAISPGEAGGYRLRKRLLSVALGTLHGRALRVLGAVSYTHLTLPTSDLV